MPNDYGQYLLHSGTYNINNVEWNVHTYIGTRDTGIVREKITQNVAQPVFSQNYYKTFAVDRNSPIIWATSEIFKTTSQSKQSPNGRKFAQSGTPDRYICTYSVRK
jgi:threonyl-tRNA synthetase